MDNAAGSAGTTQGSETLENRAGQAVVEVTGEAPKAKRKYTKRAKTAIPANDLEEVIKAMVEKAVTSRLKTARKAAVDAFNQALGL